MLLSARCACYRKNYSHSRAYTTPTWHSLFAPGSKARKTPPMLVSAMPGRCAEGPAPALPPHLLPASRCYPPEQRDGRGLLSQSSRAVRARRVCGFSSSRRRGPRWRRLCALLARRRPCPQRRCRWSTLRACPFPRSRPRGRPYEVRSECFAPRLSPRHAPTRGAATQPAAVPAAPPAAEKNAIFDLFVGSCWSLSLPGS